MKPISFFLFFSFSVSAQIQYNIVGDQYFSSIAVAENLITIHKGLHAVENKYLEPKLFDENKWYKKIGGITYRFSKTILLDHPIDYITMLFQHEVFGHGARYREFGYIESAYNVKLPFPYAKGGGWSYPVFLKNENRVFSWHEDIVRSSAGVISNTILSRTLITKWLAKKTLNYRESILYLENFHNLTGYVYYTIHNKKKETLVSTVSNDVLNYLNYLNWENEIFNEEDYQFTLKDLENQIYINAFDPFQYFAIYTYLKTYLWSGKEENKIPMIRISKVKYLPSFHLSLSPFGTEYYFENYLIIKDKIFTAYYRQGDNTFHNFGGGGIKGYSVLNNKYFYFNASIDFWKQPSLELGGDSLIKTQEGYGGEFAGTFIFKVIKKPRPVNIYAQIGYKTYGYLEGERLSKGMIIRLGVSFEEIREN